MSVEQTRLTGFPATIVGLIQGVIETVEDWFSPVFDLIIRLWIAQVFFSSGLTKIQDWENTLVLFEYEYAVPILPVPIAAFLATLFELFMPVLLVLGIAARAAAVPLLCMSLVIQFVLGANNPAYDHVEHYIWMIILLSIILKGPGRFSVDHWLRKKFFDN